MSESSDLMHVVDRTALIENIINQVIERFCQPRQVPFMFFWDVILDSSVMPLGSKVKVVLAISHEMNYRLDKDALHGLIEFRNAFAHHPLGSHPVVRAGKAGEESDVILELQVLKSSGKLARVSRAEALAKFNEHFIAAKASLVALRDAIKPQDHGAA